MSLSLRIVLVCLLAVLSTVAVLAGFLALFLAAGWLHLGGLGFALAAIGGMWLMVRLVIGDLRAFALLSEPPAPPRR